MQTKERIDWGSLATYTPNRKEPVYNWLYYKEGFSKQLVMKILDVFGAREGQLVLDPFCGSGTTCVAALVTGRHYVGLDNNEDYVQLSSERLEKAKALNRKKVV